MCQEPSPPRLETALGRDPDAPGFDAAVLAKLDEELVTRTRNEVPADFVRVVGPSSN